MILPEAIKLSDLSNLTTKHSELVFRIVGYLITLLNLQL